MGLRALLRSASVGAGLLLAFGATAQRTPEERFREASTQARAGDYPKAIELLQGLASDGHGSASLYWNWSRFAEARGERGEALWGLASARELEPWDGAVSRELERLRESANLDPAELSPDPRTALARHARALHLEWVALLCLLAGLGLRAATRFATFARWPGPAATLTTALGLVLLALTLVAQSARPLAVVVARGATLLDSASPSAAPLGTLRESEVVPILERTGDYLRIEDSAGARGWAHVDEVRPLATR